ncbi:hypothetical protein GOP47_0003496 [Adiantum capillus-veneris]|uniref:Uncharacterized protein n=1 Tax=Adiantum capillus-veneris TaxID=13818 RepID=A0A9D4ZQ75_ADICA|nr:hypothetical protein GOP47_0003496 [Adiantum capillus-veneris]
MGRSFLSEWPAGTSSAGEEESNTTGAAANAYPRLYKVPVDQRKANPQAYTPFLFSFGPYHAYLDDLEDNHAACTSHLQPPVDPLLDGVHLKRMTAAALLPLPQLANLISMIEKYEPQIRSQYVQWFNREGLDFSRLAAVLAIDAITIIAATMSQRLQWSTPLIHPLARLVLGDAILLENQIPMVVVECAIDTVRGASRPATDEANGAGEGPPLQSRAAEASFVDRYISDYSGLLVDQWPSLQGVIYWYCKHASPFTDWRPYILPPLMMGEKLDQKLAGQPLLAFLYDEICSRLTPDSAEVLLQNARTRRSIFNPVLDPSLPTASRLARCGVRFQRCHKDATISFDSKNAVLCLPRITVSDTAVRVLHNLLAYEATLRHPQEYSVVSYVHLMDCLIDTAHDVQLLEDAGVLCNKLGSDEEVASMWNKLCVSVSYRNTPSHSAIMTQLETLSKKRWNRWKANFKELYWERQPWLLLSIVAASLLFILSLLQTIYTTLGYY